MSRNGILIELYRKLRKATMWLLPKKTAHKILYKKVMGRTLHLKEPKDFNEKIQYLIVNKYGKKKEN